MRALTEPDLRNYRLALWFLCDYPSLIKHKTLGLGIIGIHRIKKAKERKEILVDEMKWIGNWPAIQFSGGVWEAETTRKESFVLKKEN